MTAPCWSIKFKTECHYYLPLTIFTKSSFSATKIHMASLLHFSTTVGQDLWKTWWIKYYNPITSIVFRMKQKETASDINFALIYFLLVLIVPWIWLIVVFVDLCFVKKIWRHCCPQQTSWILGQRGHKHFEIIPSASYVHFLNDQNACNLSRAIVIWSSLIKLVTSTGLSIIVGQLCLFFVQLGLMVCVGLCWSLSCFPLIMLYYCKHLSWN